MHSPSWESDSHTATYSRITRHYERFLAVFIDACHPKLSWSGKTPVHTDPLCFLNIDTSIIYSSVPGLWKLSFIFRFSGQIFVRISLSSYACCMLRPLLLDVPCYSLFSGFFAEMNNFTVNIYAMNIAMLQIWGGGRVARMYVEVVSVSRILFKGNIRCNLKMCGINVGSEVRRGPYWFSGLLLLW